SDSEKSLSNSQLYIMGNPPFVGARLMSEEQKQDVLDIFGAKWKNVGNLDYVCCWYKKTADLIQGTNIRAALVSTNSVSQGEQVANLWKPLMLDMGVHIDFAYRTFRWDSEASLKAHVHCVIIGFSISEKPSAIVIYSESGQPQQVKNINPYLVDASNVFIESRKQAICDNLPDMLFGSMPNDGGNFLLSKEEKETLVKSEPLTQKYIKKLLGAEEFINNKERFCLWLKGANPADLKQCPSVMERINNVREMRASSKRDATRKLADIPTLFGEIRQPETGSYLLVPSTSSERRRYIPLGFFDCNIISTNANLIIPNASLYHFGVLTSNVHMAWMRAVCGRLKSDYRYSKDIVYNNFPWPSVTEEQKAKIERTAQAILDARALYPDCSLADLYDEVTMPPELRRAHQDNDRAVMQAYGFPIKDFTESDCVARLFELYSKLTEK
ncbi:MAG: methylase, partial [Paludibacteraceae bacterium]|nr:methylase [Paludibacteraceae bacterium]